MSILKVVSKAQNKSKIPYWSFSVPRDIKERGRDLEFVLNQYMNYVKPAFEEFCLPTKKFADVIIPRGADNTGKWTSFYKFYYRLRIDRQGKQNFNYIKL